MILQKLRLIAEFLYWISLFIILFAFLNALWAIFFIFLVLASLFFLAYFIMNRRISREKEYKKKKETEVKKIKSPVKKGVTIVYAILFLTFLVIFLFSYNLFWVLLMFLSLVGYNIAKRQETKKISKRIEKKEKKIVKKPNLFSRLFARKKLKGKEPKEALKKRIKEKEKKVAKKPTLFSRLFAGRKLKGKEDKETLNKKISEIEEAKKKAKEEKEIERKKLRDIIKMLKVQKRLMKKKFKAQRKEKMLKNKMEEKERRQLEKEKRELEKIESEKRKIIEKEIKLEKIEKNKVEIISTGKIKKAIELKGKYETDLDKLLSLIERYDILKLSEIVEIFKIDKKTAEEWSNILERHNLLRMHYPAVGEPELRRIKK